MAKRFYDWFRSDWEVVIEFFSSIPRSTERQLKCCVSFACHCLLNAADRDSENNANVSGRICTKGPGERSIASFCTDSGQGFAALPSIFQASCGHDRAPFVRRYEYLQEVKTSRNSIQYYHKIASSWVFLNWEASDSSESWKYLNSIFWYLYQRNECICALQRRQRTRTNVLRSNIEVFLCVRQWSDQGSPKEKTRFSSESAATTLSEDPILFIDMTRSTETRKKRRCYFALSI